MRHLLSCALALLTCALPAQAGPVGDAAKSGDTAEIERLIASGADLNEADAMASPLHWAAMNGHASAVTLLTNHGADLDANSSMLGTPLHAAARFGHVEAIKALLAAGANPDARDRNEFTPMMHGIMEDRTEVVAALLASGADVNAVGIAPGGSHIGGGPTIALQLSIAFKRDAATDLLRAAGAGPIPPEVPGDLEAMGDAERGRELAYTYCEECHTISAGDPQRLGEAQGPPLIGVIGTTLRTVRRR